MPVVSAQVADWSREARAGGVWQPSRALLASIRQYQRHVGRTGPLHAIARRHAALRHRFWSAVTGADIPLNCLLGGGLLLPHPNVCLGGDIATAGRTPRDGWRILVQDLPEDPACEVMLEPGSAMATSSTQKRRWRRSGERMHHILDPRTGRPAETVWRSVTVAATSCWAANTLSTAAIVKGADAPEWLAAIGAPARLVAQDGAVVTLAGWPDDASRPPATELATAV